MLHDHSHVPRARRAPFTLIPSVKEALVALSCCVALSATTGCAAAAVEPLSARTPSSALVVDDAAERALVVANGGAGRLLVLSEAEPGSTTIITVHGINAAPATIQSIHDRAVKCGARLLTFLHDDQKRRLTDSAEDLALAVAADLRRHGTGRLVIYAHSMGARIAVAAFGARDGARDREGDLASPPVELRLIAPALGGFGAANMAAVAPAMLERVIPGVAPGVDLGTSSRFQATLERAWLSMNVTTHIYVGDQDHVIDSRSSRFREVARALRADVTLVPGADHDSIVERVAEMELTPYSAAEVRTSR